MQVNVHGQPDASSGDAPALDAATKAKAALPVGVVIDDRGRRITVKQLDPSRVFQLAMAMGQTADSEFARNYASFAACVREIDGEICPFPTNVVQIQGMMGRLGTEGVDAVMTALSDIALAKLPTNVAAEKL